MNKYTYYTILDFDKFKKNGKPMIKNIFCCGVTSAAMLAGKKMNVRMKKILRNKKNGKIRENINLNYRLMRTSLENAYLIQLEALHAEGAIKLANFG